MEIDGTRLTGVVSEEDVHSEEADDREVSEVSVQRLRSVLSGNLTASTEDGGTVRSETAEDGTRTEAAWTDAISSGEAPFRSAMSCSLILLFWIREYSTFKTE